MVPHFLATVWVGTRTTKDLQLHPISFFHELPLDRNMPIKASQSTSFSHPGLSPYLRIPSIARRKAGSTAASKRIPSRARRKAGSTAASQPSQPSASARRKAVSTAASQPSQPSASARGSNKLQGPSTDGEDLVVASSHPKQSHAIEAGGTAVSKPPEPSAPAQWSNKLHGPSIDREHVDIASLRPERSHAIEVIGGHPIAASSSPERSHAIEAIGASMPLEPRGPPIDAVVVDVARLMNFFDEKFNSVCHPPSPIPVEFHLEEHRVDEQPADDEPAAEKDSASNSTRLHNDVGHKVCHVCGMTPCEWEQYGLTIITLMMHAFDHQNRSPNGLLLDPCTNQAVDNRTARRLAYKMYQYEKFGTINSSKSLPVSCCVVRQIKSLYP